MRPTNRNAILLISQFLMAAVSFAVSPDSRLLRLVPPESQIVAGMHAPSVPDQPGNFLLITHNNTVDLNDFYALTGADRSRIIGQVVFVAGPAGPETDSEHSLLVSGHFDQSSIFKTAGSTATPSTYRGVAVLVVSPLERERATFRDIRWLTILESQVALFGTPANVLQELDRYLANSRTEPAFLEQLSLLRHNDDSWCLVTASLPSEVVDVLGALDARLTNIGASRRPFAFGIHYGNQVEFDYQEVPFPSADDPQSPLNIQFSGPNPKATSMFVRPGNEGEMRIRVKIPRQRYERWLSGIFASHGIPHPALSANPSLLP